MTDDSSTGADTTNTGADGSAGTGHTATGDGLSAFGVLAVDNLPCTGFEFNLSTSRNQGGEEASDLASHLECNSVAECPWITTPKQVLEFKVDNTTAAPQSVLFRSMSSKLSAFPLSLTLAAMPESSIRPQTLAHLTSDDSSHHGNPGQELLLMLNAEWSTSNGAWLSAPSTVTLLYTDSGSGDSCSLSTRWPRSSRNVPHVVTAALSSASPCKGALYIDGAMQDARIVASTGTNGASSSTVLKVMSVGASLAHLASCNTAGGGLSHLPFSGKLGRLLLHASALNSSDARQVTLALAGSPAAGTASVMAAAKMDVELASKQCASDGTAQVCSTAPSSGNVLCGTLIGGDYSYGPKAIALTLWGSALRCSYVDKKRGLFSQHGVDLVALSSDTVRCRSYHMSDFALSSESPSSPSTCGLARPVVRASPQPTGAVQVAWAWNATNCSGGLDHVEVSHPWHHSITGNNSWRPVRSNRPPHIYGMGPTH
jgi:hypothetical protein